MRNTLICFAFGILCFFGAGATSVQPVGACPAFHVLHPLSVVTYFVFGALCFARALDRLTEWQEAKKFFYPIASSATEGWEALFVILAVLFPGALFTWAGTQKEGGEIGFLLGCTALVTSSFLFLCRFKPTQT